MSKKVVTMGEIMLRLSTPGNERFIQADEFDVCYGGGEANVAVSLANYGYDTQFVTAVPDNPIGACAVAALRKHNVGTDFIAKSGERLGIYFLETGSAMRASNVVYDRAHSSISTASVDEFDFDAIFKDADWFHFTGITPGLTDKTAALTLYACKKAKEMGLTVSCDPNYRSKLWTKEKAGSVMSEILPYVDVLITNEGQSADIFGIVPPNPSPIGVPTSHESAIFIAEELRKRFGCGKVAITIRTTLSGDLTRPARDIISGET